MRRYRTLDGLRGMGALVVMAYHFYCFKVFPGAFFTKGYLAVDLFFVLSGVVLAEAYTARLSQGLSTFNFLKIRFIRLYPYYFISLVASLAMTLIYLCFFKINSVHWTTGSFLGSLIFSIFMLPSPFMARLFPFVDQAWSLLYELLVNFFWAGTRTRLKSAGFGATVIFAAAGLITLGHSTGLDGGGSWRQIDMGIFRVLYSFCIGLLIHAMDKSWIPKLNPWVILLVAFGVLGSIPPQSLSPLFDLTAVLLVLPCCVLFATVVEPPKGVQSGFLDFMGDSSYGIYMIHFEVAMFIHWVLNKFGFSPSFLVAAMAMAGVVMAAHWLNSVWDRPARVWLSGMARRDLTRRDWCRRPKWILLGCPVANIAPPVWGFNSPGGRQNGPEPEGPKVLGRPRPLGMYDHCRTPTHVVVPVPVVVVPVMVRMADLYPRNRHYDLGGQGSDPEKKEAQKNRAHEFLHR